MQLQPEKEKTFVAFSYVKGQGKQITLHLFVNKRIEVTVASTVTSHRNHKLEGPWCLFKVLWTLLAMD